MIAKVLVPAIVDLLAQYDQASYADKIAALEIAKFNMQIEVYKAVKGTGATPPRANGNAPRGDGGGEGHGVTPEQVKEAAKRTGARVSIKKNGGVGISFDSGKKWTNYKPNELPAALDMLLHA